MADAEDFWPAVDKGLKQALVMLVKMRGREGSHLRQELSHRMDLIRKAVGKVRKHAPAVQEKYRQQLMERIKNAGLDAAEERAGLPAKGSARPFRCAEKSPTSRSLFALFPPVKIRFAPKIPPAKGV